MNIAFYAPMKSPNHPRPSGDRHIARLLIKAMEKMGHQLEVMSELRAWEGQGDQTKQRAIGQKAGENAEQIIKKLRARPADQQADLWFSYHLYHKAPDWIGPRVAAALNLPYVVAEASYASKQIDGPWSTGLTQVADALRQAGAIICLNPRDIPELEKRLDCANKIKRLAPFLDLDKIKPMSQSVAKHKIAKRYDLNPDLPWLISVAMMRKDAKLESYHLLAESLSKLTQATQLLVVGDGAARDEVEALFSGNLAAQTRFAGQLDQADTYQALRASDVFVWPAVNEAIGMAILEAQACGLPVVVGNSGAIKDIIHDEKTGFVCAPHDTQRMAKCIDQLLASEKMRAQYAKSAINNIEQFHSLDAAAQSLNQILVNCLA